MQNIRAMDSFARRPAPKITHSIPMLICPEASSAALARYIDTVRPPVPDSEVFIRLQAPWRPIKPSSLYDIANREFVALGFARGQNESAPKTGALPKIQPVRASGGDLGRLDLQ
jgi:hypothetical protein